MGICGRAVMGRGIGGLIVGTRTRDGMGWGGEREVALGMGVIGKRST
jgi:hypothetical protein